MGGEQSQLPPTPHGFPFFSITLRRNDKLKLVNADTTVVGAVRGALMTHWSGGIQREENDFGAISFKVHGNPFSPTSGEQEAVQIRALFCQILSNLQQIGWQLVGSSDLSRTQDLTTWWFERNTAIINDLHPQPIVCVSISSSDKLQLVNVPEYLFESVKLVILSHRSGNMEKITVVLSACKPMLRYFYLVSVKWLQFAGHITRAVVENLGLLQNHQTLGYLNAYKIKINGYPWHNADFETGLTARLILLGVFREFDRHKFKYLGSANVKGHADAMFFQRVRVSHGIMIHDACLWSQDDSVVPGETHFGCLSLNANDRFRLIDLPESLVPVFKDCIAQFWPRGLQEHILHPECQNVHELKMNGNPWNTWGDDAAASRLLITKVFEAMLAHGWAIHTALDISRRINDKGIFIMRRCMPTTMAHFALAPEDTDKIRLLNAPQNVHDATRKLIMNYWPYGVQREGPVFGGYEWKLKGNPWHPNMGNEYMVARNLIACFLATMSPLGWRLACSADVSAKFYRHHSKHSHVEYPLDVHTLFFVYTGVSAPTAHDSGTAPPPTAPSLYPDPDLDAPPTYEQAVS